MLAKPSQVSSARTPERASQAPKNITYEYVVVRYALPAEYVRSGTRKESLARELAIHPTKDMLCFPTVSSIDIFVFTLHGLGCLRNEAVWRACYS